MKVVDFVKRAAAHWQRGNPTMRRFTQTEIESAVFLGAMHGAEQEARGCWPKCGAAALPLYRRAGAVVRALTGAPGPAPSRQIREGSDPRNRDVGSPTPSLQAGYTGRPGKGGRP